MHFHWLNAVQITLSFVYVSVPNILCISTKDFLSLSHADIAEHKVLNLTAQTAEALCATAIGGSGGGVGQSGYAPPPSWELCSILQLQNHLSSSHSQFNRIEFLSHSAQSTMIFVRLHGCSVVPWCGGLVGPRPNLDDLIVSSVLWHCWFGHLTCNNC